MCANNNQTAHVHAHMHACLLLPTTFVENRGCVSCFPHNGNPEEQRHQLAQYRRHVPPKIRTAYLGFVCVCVCVFVMGLTTCVFVMGLASLTTLVIY